jgi:hypothetical protein
LSHAEERKEKNCLNCGANVIGRYCHICGQENIVPKESFLKLVAHFFYDITHFDTNFLSTLRHLLFKPGFLSKEYIRGRRASYLNPVRMYVFTSAIFFLVFFAVVKPQINVSEKDRTPLKKSERIALLADLKNELGKKGADTSVLQKQIVMLLDTSREITRAGLVSANAKNRGIYFNGKRYSTVSNYDSVQRSLPEGKRDGWLKRAMVHRATRFDEKMREDPNNAWIELFEDFMHKLPYLLFISLPIFALILKLLYVRRKQFFYADHAIFSIHHYIFSFILLLVFFLVDELKKTIGGGIFDWIEIILLLLWPIYLYAGMKNFYRQGWRKTFLKFFLLNILGFISLVILFVIFFSVAFLQTK